MTNDGLGYSLVLLTLVLAILAHRYKSPVLYLASTGGWLLLAIFMYNLSAGGWDVYYGLFWFSMGLVIVTSMEAYMTRQSNKQKELIDMDAGEEEDPWDRHADSMEKRRASLNKVRRSALHRGNGRRKKRGSRFSETGEL